MGRNRVIIDAIREIELLYLQIDHSLGNYLKLCYLGVLLHWVQDEVTSGRQDAQKVVVVAAVVHGTPDIESRRLRHRRGAC